MYLKYQCLGPWIAMPFAVRTPTCLLVFFCTDPKVGSEALDH